MAELLVGIGGAAAATQLLRYGAEFTLFVSALPGQLRHAPEKITTWSKQSSAMLGLLDEIKSNAKDLDPNTLYLLQQCREDITKLESLLYTAYLDSNVSRRSKLKKLSFVLRKEAEIEHMMVAFKSNFNTVALSMIL